MEIFVTQVLKSAKYSNKMQMSSIVLFIITLTILFKLYIIVRLITPFLFMSVVNILNSQKFGHDSTKLTDDMHNSKLSEKQNFKKVSAIQNCGKTTEGTDKKPTYLNRAKFFLSARSVIPIFNVCTTVISIEIHCQTELKCIHVHHLEFVLAISALTTRLIEDPETITCYTAVSISGIRITDPRAPLYTNKYIFSKTRFENKCHKNTHRTKMQNNNTLNGKNSRKYWKRRSIHLGARIFSGTNTNNCSIQPKYHVLYGTDKTSYIIQAPCDSD